MPGEPGCRRPPWANAPSTGDREHMQAFARQPALLSAWAAALLLGIAYPLPAAAPLAPTAPRDEQLCFVPEDVCFCLVVQGVRSHAAALSASPFAQQFRRSAPGKALA